LNGHLVVFEESEEMLDSRPPFSWHPAATVENPNMHYLSLVSPDKWWRV
jgi:hypothetical protein